MIEVSALTVKYPGRKRPVLRDLSLQVPRGQTLLILGPSGSGKSSLALTFNGLIPHSIAEVLGGQVRVAGADTQETPVAQLAQQVGILFQDPDAQFATMTVEDEIVFGLENLCLDPAEMESRVQAALSQVGMLHARRRPLFALSGGEKQRIALAALLAMQPEVLVFDEPTANLDSVGTQQVFALLAQLKAGGRHTLILIEHKLDELMHLVDRVVVLDMEGRVFADGPPRQVFDRHAGELQEMGVWMPQVCLLAQQLRQAGLALAAFPVTIGEAVKALGPALAGAPPPPVLAAPAAKAQRTSVYSIKHLSYSYGDIPALHNISMEIAQGDFLAIVGPNGAGKSTLARHLIGLLTPPSDTVYLDGRDIHSLEARQLAAEVAYVFQNPEHQFVTERVDEEVAFGLRAAGMDEEQVAAQTARVLETFGLARYAPANPFMLSHGEKRRLSVAAMLAVGQQILILDEPTFGQDERNAAALMALLRALNAQGKTVIMITHDMRLVAEAADKVAVILDGRLEFFGQPGELFAQGDLLARAHLNLPPLARLAALLSTQHPQMQGCVTVQDYLYLAEAAGKVQA